MVLETLLQSCEVGWHFPAGLAADDERDEQLTDAVALEVDGDGQAGSMGGQGFDGDVDDGPDGSVDAPHTPRLGWVGVRDFRRARTVAAADAPDGQASRSHGRDARLVPVNIDDARLPLAEASRVGGVGEHV